MRTYIQYALPQLGDECPDCRRPMGVRMGSFFNDFFFCLTRRKDNTEIWRKCEECARKEGW